MDGSRGKGSVIGFYEIFIAIETFNDRNRRSSFFGDLPAEPSFVCLSSQAFWTKSCKIKRSEGDVSEMESWRKLESLLIKIVLFDANWNWEWFVMRSMKKSSPWELSLMLQLQELLNWIWSSAWIRWCDEKLVWWSRRNMKKSLSFKSSWECFRCNLIQRWVCGRHSESQTDLLASILNEFHHQPRWQTFAEIVKRKKFVKPTALKD